MTKTINWYPCMH